MDDTHADVIVSKILEGYQRNGEVPGPDMQILFLPRTTQGRDPIKEADIRPIAKSLDWNRQRQMLNRLRQSTIGLPSLPRMYPGLHHTHQKFSLLVLIQFVLQIAIYSAGAIQR